MFDGSWRTGVDTAVQPVGRALVRAHVTPDFLTALGLLFSVATAICIGAGQLRWGFVLLVASALPDLLDGAVAKAGQSASARGAFFDSVADRITDSLVFGGIAWHLSVTRNDETHIIALALMGASQLISYERAKAEIYGWDAKGGLMERAERIISLCVALVFTPFLVPILEGMLVLTVLTAAYRFVKVWRQAGRPPKPTLPPPVMSDRAPLGERWRSLRKGPDPVMAPGASLQPSQTGHSHHD